MSKGLKTPESKLRATRKYRAKRRKDPKWRKQQAEYMRRYREENREALTEKDRKYQQDNAVRIQLRRKGLSLEWEEHIENHDGCCDICGGPPDGKWKKLNIDHDHETGEFRGMLCFRCNRALGYFRATMGSIMSTWLRGPEKTTAGT